MNLYSSACLFSSEWLWFRMFFDVVVMFLLYINVAGYYVTLMLLAWLYRVDVDGRLKAFRLAWRVVVFVSPFRMFEYMDPHHSYSYIYIYIR